MEKLISRIINIVFIIVFSFILLGGLFYKNQVFMPEHQIFVIFSTVLWFLILFFGYKFINKINIKKSNMILILMFFAFFLLQLFFAYMLRVYPTWDFGGVYYVALNYVDVGNFDLYKLYPNNYFLAYCFGFFYKIISIFGISKFFRLSIILNIFLIDSSIFLVYLVVKKLLNVNAALFSALMCLCSTPFLLYTPIFYSDTLTMFIPILMVYIVILLDETNSKKKQFLLILFLVLLAFVGYKIKASILVVIVAIIIYWLFRDRRLKEGLSKFGIFLLIFVFIVSSFSLIEKNVILKDARKSGIVFPITHWIMMGLNSDTNIYGGFLPQDVDITNNSEDKVYTNIAIIKSRISERKFLGNLHFYARKIVDTWCDGTYFAPEKLSRKPVEENFLHQFVLNKGNYFDILFCVSTGYILALYLFMVFAAILKRNDNKFNYILLLQCILLGIWLFLLIWETRSRYLVNFVPLMIVLATLSLNLIYEKINVNNK